MKKKMRRMGRGRVLAIMMMNMVRMMMINLLVSF